MASQRQWEDQVLKGSALPCLQLWHSLQAGAVTLGVVPFTVNGDAHHD